MATLVSLSFIVNDNPVTINDSTTFQVMATFADGRTVDVGDSCTYAMSVADIAEINGIELWLSTATWASTDLW